MKFEFDQKNPTRDPVAILTDGGLKVKTGDGWVIIYDDYSGYDDCCGLETVWKETRKFYPGDKLTITF